MFFAAAIPFDFLAMFVALCVDEEIEKRLFGAIRCRQNEETRFSSKGSSPVTIRQIRNFDAKGNMFRSHFLNMLLTDSEGNVACGFGTFKNESMVVNESTVPCPESDLCVLAKWTMTAVGGGTMFEIKTLNNNKEINVVEMVARFVMKVCKILRLARNGIVPNFRDNLRLFHEYVREMDIVKNAKCTLRPEELSTNPDMYYLLEITECETIILNALSGNDRWDERSCTIIRSADWKAKYGEMDLADILTESHTLVYRNCYVDVNQLLNRNNPSYRSTCDDTTESYFIMDSFAPYNSNFGYDETIGQIDLTQCPPIHAFAWTAILNDIKATTMEKFFGLGIDFSQRKRICDDDVDVLERKAMEMLLLGDNDCHQTPTMVSNEDIGGSGDEVKITDADNKILCIDNRSGAFCVCPTFID
eukprot:TRINITY_DN3434_c0_g1_i4.p1 TRINITY_DN3434_c0_g1~~TRINITY_DN3434_c0_g1_i4.p1  ORF type:complete len:417 (+),score=97.69 TRINITY_DN3434_c0_g1_i4:203-1453(+)